MVGRLNKDIIYITYYRKLTLHEITCEFKNLAFTQVAVIFVNVNFRAISYM